MLPLYIKGNLRTTVRLRNVRDHQCYTSTLQHNPFYFRVEPQAASPWQPLPLQRGLIVHWYRFCLRLELARRQRLFCIPIPNKK